MKIFHVSDLHIGKQLNTYNLKDLQEDILSKIIYEVKNHQPDVLLMAGDIYDKSVPSAEAFDMFDQFLSEYSKVNPTIPAMIIAGNHDDASRLNYGSTFFASHNIYISTLPPKREEEHLFKKTFTDAYGEVDVYLLPFTRPSMVRNFMDVSSYHSAVEKLIERENIDYTRRNVLVSHQFFVSGESRPERSQSELNYLSVGGIDSVDISCVEKFDYVALGHIHRAQKVGEEHIRYSGTPIKYSLSEVGHIKGIQVIELKEKGNITYDFISLETNPKIRSIKGTLQEVLDASTSENKEDYVYIHLMDHGGFNPLEKLREKYSRIVEVTSNQSEELFTLVESEDVSVQMDPLTSFMEFYEQLKGKSLEKEEIALLEEIIEEAKESLS